MTSKHREAWLRLRAILKKVPRKRFDMGHWVGSDWEGAPDLSCGTSACAAGWATTDPWFRRRGLWLDSNGSPSYARLRSLFGDAAMVETWQVEASGLFFRHDIRTPRQFIREIDKLLAKEERT